MRQIHHAAGNPIFREGDRDPDIAFILAGRVEISKRMNSEDLVLGDVGAGEFIGEMSAIQGLPRGVSARAKTPVDLLLMTPGEFIERLREDPDAALQIILRLSEQLRTANEHELHDASTPRAVLPFEAMDKPVDLGSCRLFSDSPSVDLHVPLEGTPLVQLPFYVGRIPHGDERPPVVRIHLRLEDHVPYRLSREHFSIHRASHGYAVRDATSYLGTIVNDQLIGQHAPRTSVDLRPGENRIVAGGASSPYRFIAVVDA